ncbi:MAG TPA: ribonuclease HII [Beijerinckiaceae bacterium]|nr:ribonuclease HII [Beijerinckiaceae bacterium]
MPHFRVERRLAAGGVWPIAGVDEAGRGPLAGPVAAAAVILDPNDLPKGLDDSKRLAPHERERLYELVLKKALAVAAAFASAAEIDRLNIRQATHLAMRRAAGALALAPVHLLVDGNDLPADLCCRGQTIVQGDASSMSIAAASIIAKVTRDRLMRRLAVHHPEYGFEQHVGYATRAHLEALRAHGPTCYHRRSFAPVLGALAAV